MSSVFFIAFAAIAIIGLVFSWLSAAKRREELAEFAAQRNWSFEPDDDAAFPAEHNGFHLFEQGHSARSANTMRGNIETRIGAVSIQTGDHAYTTGHGKNSHRHKLSYFFATLPFPMPRGTHLFIRRENFGDRIGAALGFDDIDFESEEFSRRYFVKSSDRKFAFAVIHPRMIEFLLASPCGPLELLDGRILFHDTDENEWSPEQFAEAADWFASFLGLWPDYLVNTLASREPSRS